MTSSLGEKLRTAREGRGISISEVAEQTRISPLYLEAIDRDDYKGLPGGIFNKGFVRSYAKYVGVDEQEALQDYSRQMAESSPPEQAEVRSYRPEVLTDDRAISSMVPTVIFAVVILALMTAGILFLVNYIQNRQSEPPIAANTAVNTAPSNTGTAANTSVPVAAGSAPTMGAVKIEFTAVGDAVSLTSMVDGGKSREVLLQPGTPAVFEPTQSLKLRYSRSRAQFAQVTVNGKPIALPQEPVNPKAATIEVEINGTNLPTIWQNASFVTPAAAPADATPVTTTPAGNTATVAPTRPVAKPSVTPKPAATNTNSAAAPPTMTGRPPARPEASPAAVRPPANTER